VDKEKNCFGKMSYAKFSLDFFVTCCSETGGMLRRLMGMDASGRKQRWTQKKNIIAEWNCSLWHKNSKTLKHHLQKETSSVWSELTPKQRIVPLIGNL